MKQKYSSKKTAINGKQGKLPKAFKMTTIPKGSLVLDYGGGDSDAWKIAQEYLNQFDATEAIYDPFNQTAWHNECVAQACKDCGGADVTICANVLNVIMEKEIRNEVLQNIKKFTKVGGIITFYIHEGDKSGIGKPTQNNESWQNNMRASEYMDEIKAVFPNAVRHGQMIAITKKEA